MIVGASSGPTLAVSTGSPPKTLSWTSISRDSSQPLMKPAQARMPSGCEVSYVISRSVSARSSTRSSLASAAEGDGPRRARDDAAGVAGDHPHAGVETCPAAHERTVADAQVERDASALARRQVAGEGGEQPVLAADPRRELHEHRRRLVALEPDRPAAADEPPDPGRRVAHEAHVRRAGAAVGRVADVRAGVELDGHPVEIGVPAQLRLVEQLVPEERG